MSMLVADGMCAACLHAAHDICIDGGKQLIFTPLCTSLCASALSPPLIMDMARLKAALSTRKTAVDAQHSSTTYATRAINDAQTRE